MMTDDADDTDMPDDAFNMQCALMRKEKQTPEIVNHGHRTPEAHQHDREAILQLACSFLSLQPQNLLCLFDWNAGCKSGTSQMAEVPDLQPKNGVQRC